MTSNQLQRSLGLYLVVFYGLGNILGAGIYVLVGKVAGVAGMYTPLAFVVACFVASFTALAYAELTAKFPVSAGEAVYVHQGFGSKHLALFIGLMVAISAAVSSATIARGFVGYLQVFIDIPAWLAICLLLITLTSIAALGVKHAVGVAAVLTLVEITGLLLVIIVGADSFTTIPQRLPELIPDFSATTIIAIMAGGFLAFYAFLGFEDMVNVAEEVKNPERNLPMGIILSLIIATLFYALIALVAVLNVPPKQLAMSDAPLALVYESATGQRPIIISIISLFAVVNGALIQIIMIARILYGMSTQQWLPSFLSTIHPRTNTPVLTTLIVGLIVLLFALIFPLLTLAKVTSFFILAVFVFVNLALILIRRRSNEKFVYPVWVPYVGLFSSIALVTFEIINQI